MIAGRRADDCRLLHLVELLRERPEHRSRSCEFRNFEAHKIFGDGLGRILEALAMLLGGIDHARR